MNLKSIEKWGVILEKNGDAVIFENYIYGFEKISYSEHSFETLRIFITFNKNNLSEIKRIEVFPWSKGKTYTTLEYLIAAALMEEIHVLIQKELVPQTKTLLFNQMALTR